MRKISAVLGVVSVVACIAASSATAASESKIRVEAQAVLTSPTGVLLTVSYKCSEGPAELGAIVAQESTQAFAFQGEFHIPVTCTGKWETVSLRLGPPGLEAPAFELGDARASATIYHGDEIVSRERKIRIVA